MAPSTEPFEHPTRGWTPMHSVQFSIPSQINSFFLFETTAAPWLDVLTAPNDQPLVDHSSDDEKKEDVLAADSTPQAPTSVPISEVSFFLQFCSTMSTTFETEQGPLEAHLNPLQTPASQKVTQIVCAVLHLLSLSLDPARCNCQNLPTKRAHLAIRRMTGWIRRMNWQDRRYQISLPRLNRRVPLPLLANSTSVLHRKHKSPRCSTKFSLCSFA